MDRWQTRRTHHTARNATGATRWGRRREARPPQWHAPMERRSKVCANVWREISRLPRLLLHSLYCLTKLVLDLERVSSYPWRKPALWVWTTMLRACWQRCCWLRDRSGIESIRVAIGCKPDASALLFVIDLVAPQVRSHPLHHRHQLVEQQGRTKLVTKG